MTKAPTSPPAQRIAAVRKERGLSQRELSRLANYALVSRLERGERIVTWVAAERIGSVLGVRPEWIMTGEGLRDAIMPPEDIMGRVRDGIGFDAALRDLRAQLGDAANEEALARVGETIVSSLPPEITPYYLGLVLQVVEAGMKSAKRAR